MVPKIGQFPNPMGGTPKDDPMKNVSNQDYPKVQVLLQDLKMAEAFGQANRIANIKAQLVNLGYDFPPDKSQSSISVFGQGNNQLQRPEGYVVQKGDTLSKIAKQFNLNLQDLIAANPEIKNPNAIQLGLAIKLPPSKQQSAPAAEQPAAAPIPDKDTAAEEESAPVAEAPVPAEENAPAEKKPLTQAPPPPDMDADQWLAFGRYKQDIKRFKEMGYEVKYDEKTGHTYVDMDGDGEYEKCYDKNGSLNYEKKLTQAPAPRNMNPDQQKVFDNYLKDIQQYKENAYHVEYEEKYGFTYVDMNGDGDYDKCYNKDGSVRFDLTPISPEEAQAQRNAGREPAVWYNPFTWF